MALLMDVLADPNRRKQIVADAGVVLEQEVSDKGGISGLAIKGAFGIVKNVKPGIIPEVIDGLLPEFAKAIDPVLVKMPPGADVERYLQDKSNDCVQGMLGVTDARAERTTHQVLLRAYKQLRPTAEKHVAAAMPRVAKLIARYLKP